MPARLRVRGSLGWFGPSDLVDHPAIVIEGSRIAHAGEGWAAPEADHEIAGDWFLMPGAVDHHVHLGLSDPKSVLRGGVTTVRDLGWPADRIFPLVDISEATNFDGPAIAAAGPMITAPGGYPTRAGWAPPGTGLEVEGTEAAAAAVERLASEGASIIKVALNAEAGPTLGDAELVAVCTAASSRGLRVTAHAQGPGQTERALGAGVDELAHCPWTERLSDDVIEALARTTTIVSTLDIHSYGRPTPELEVAVTNLARFRAAGGRVRYGTDLGNGPIPPGIHPGEARHLAAAGLPAEGILEAMAGAPLQPGAPADLVALGGNPLDDLAALGRVEVVVRSGHIRHRGGGSPGDDPGP